MSPPKSANMIEELAKDYADYAKVDLSSQMKTLHDTIEDIVTRLEEFESILQMVQIEEASCLNDHIPKLEAVQPQLKMLCKRIDVLEHVVATANMNLTALESAVANAEAELGTSDRLFNILNPLSFFKKNQEPAPPNRISTYETPIIYKADDYFTDE